MNVDKFGRVSLSIEYKKIQRTTKTKLRRIESTIDTLQQKIDHDNKENIKRFAVQLFYWINAAHSTKPSTMALADITRTKDDYIDWSKVFIEK